ncbi:MAG: hypothetical protein ACYCS1_05050 [Gammaproteobacteria bacterium]
MINMKTLRDKVIELNVAGFSGKVIAEKLAISQGRVSQILNPDRRLSRNPTYTLKVIIGLWRDEILTKDQAWEAILKLIEPPEQKEE